MAKSKRLPADYIEPLHINGLTGRMLRLPPPAGKKREILFVYGHHASLERCWGFADDLNQYGGVTSPDLPGFGGMDSFYKIGKEPSIDNLADYLASFIKLRYRNRRFTIVGFSFGFVVATRMLQRYPDLAKKVDLLVSAVGFAHKSDFTFSKPRYFGYLTAARLFSHKLPAIFFRNVFLHPALLRLVYGRTHNAKEKFAGLSRAEHKALMDFEVHLWHCNDVRTHMSTSAQFLTLDNCHKRVALPVWHVAVDLDRYFDNHSVAQHLGVIFEDVTVVKSAMKNHGPSVIVDKEAARPFIPQAIRNRLDQD